MQSLASVPAPATLLLLVAALVGMGAARRKLV
ncbi:PEP-CTERM sorting domain-containing protein [Corallincola spongiicola]